MLLLLLLWQVVVASCRHSASCRWQRLIIGRERVLCIVPRNICSLWRCGLTRQKTTGQSVPQFLLCRVIQIVNHVESYPWQWEAAAEMGERQCNSRHSLCICDDSARARTSSPSPTILTTTTSARRRQWQRRKRRRPMHTSGARRSTQQSKSEGGEGIGGKRMWRRSRRRRGATTRSRSRTM